MHTHIRCTHDSRISMSTISLFLYRHIGSKPLIPFWLYYIQQEKYSKTCLKSVHQYAYHHLQFSQVSHILLSIMDEKETQIITYDDFAKLQLKTGKVLECVKAENAEKLYILQVDLGEEKPRQIVSSLVDYYSAEALVGKEIVVLANLKPAKMRGHLSQGMLLCAETADSSVCVLLKPEISVPSGTAIT